MLITHNWKTMMKKVQKWTRNVNGVLMLIEAISFVLGLFFLIPCVKAGGLFWSVDYSGHGFWGWLALYCTCAFTAGIIAMLVLWPLGFATRKPRWACLVLGTAFLAMSVLGASQHTPNPLIAELGCITAAWYGFYCGLYSQNNDEDEQQDKR